MDFDPVKKLSNGDIVKPTDIEDIPNEDDPDREYIDPLYDAGEVISEVLWDENSGSYKTLIDYAVNRNQIEIKDVELHIRQSEAFQKFVREFGWPNGKDDNGIEPPREYGTEGEPDYGAFLNAFVLRSTLADNLDNFRLWLVVEPNAEPFDGLDMTRVWATHPALHRLYAIMPRLMSAAHTLVKDIHDRNADNLAGFANEMSAGKNEELVKVLYMIYQVAGRLLKSDDKTRHRKILGLPEPAERTIITDAHTELRA